MYEVSIKSEFSSAHRLRGYKGKCEELHGHNWKVETIIRKEKLDKIGMAIDFRELKLKLNEILTQLDHRYLNNLSYFKKINPTSENIAKYIFDRFNRKFKDNKLKVFKVTVWESDACAASFFK
ncbi:MAG: 6-carboxytetrahydropterin synthase QueD [Candidatus Omnitrophica bacterium]|nr:6-carboxytetrahydropterin synthase QueD [Candidatus Omnitrophota bacterium]